MDPAQAETGGKSITSKLRAKAPHSRVKDKVKNLKNLLPGMKKHAGGDDEGHEDSSEYDNDSPRSPGPETGYNVNDSKPFNTVKTTPTSQDSYSPPSNERSSPREVQNRDYDTRPSQINPSGYDSRPSQINPSGYDSRPSQINPSGYDSRPSQINPSGYDSRPSQINPSGYDSRPSQINPSGYDTQNRNYVATAPPTRSAPLPADSPRSNLAPSMEEKFRYLDVGERAPRAVNPQSDRSYQPEQQYSPSVTNPQTDPIRSYQPEQQYSPSVTNPQTDPIRSYQPEQQYSPSEENPQTDPIRSYQPEQQYSPSEENPQTEPIRSYQPEQDYSPSVTNPQTDPIRSSQPEQQYPPSTIESIQKGYSDGPRTSYRASPTAPANKSMVDKVKESVVGTAVVLGEKVGYYNDDPAVARDPNAPSILDKAKSTLGLDKPRDPNAPSIVDKTKATLGLDKPRDPNAPSIVDKTKGTLGLDKPRDPNAPPLTEKAKAYMNVASQKTKEYSATAADHAAWTKDRVAAHTTPTHHDKALSEQVTQTLSALPGAIREKVFGRASPSANSANSPKTPGIADRLSGAVSSLFTSAPKPTGERLQHTFPVQSDYHGKPAAASVPQNFADRSLAEERMPATPTPAYAPSATPTPAYAPSYPMVNN